MWIAELAAQETDAVLDSLDPDKDWPRRKGGWGWDTPRIQGDMSRKPLLHELFWAEHIYFDLKNHGFR